MRHLASRGLLFVLTAFLSLTALVGGFIVVPGLPLEWIAGGPFSDYTIPAAGLVAIGSMAALTAVLVLVRPTMAGAIAIVLGAALVAFIAVEIAVVGFTLIDDGASEPMAWLQVVYLAVGVGTAAVGYALWHDTAEDREREMRTGHGLMGPGR